MSWLLASVHNDKNVWYVSTVVGRHGRIPQWQKSVAFILYLPRCHRHRKQSCVTGNGKRL